MLERTLDLAPVRRKRIAGDGGKVLLLCTTPDVPASIAIKRWRVRRLRLRIIWLHPEILSVARGKDFGGGIHALVLAEEAANIACKLPVFSGPGGVQHSGGLTVCRSYRLPSLRTTRNERRQCCPAACYGDGLLVRATVRVGNLEAPLCAESRPYLDQRHARSGNPLSPRPSWRRFGSHAPRAQLASKALAETVELDRARIEPGAIQPLGLHRQMNMRARRVAQICFWVRGRFVPTVLPAFHAARACMAGSNLE